MVNANVLTVTNKNFDQIISSGVVVVDFWANWCGPCRMVSPIVDEIAGEHPDIKVGKVNIDEQRELAAAFQIVSIPTLLVMKHGKVVNQAVGARPKQQILSMIFQTQGG